MRIRIVITFGGLLLLGVSGNLRMLFALCDVEQKTIIISHSHPRVIQLHTAFFKVGLRFVYCAKWERETFLFIVLFCVAFIVRGIGVGRRI